MSSKKAMAPEYAVGLIFAALLILMTIYTGDLLVSTFGDAKDQDAISNFGSLGFDIERVVNSNQEFASLTSFVKIPEKFTIAAFSSTEDKLYYFGSKTVTTISAGATGGTATTSTVAASTPLLKPKKCERKACICLYKNLPKTLVDCTLYPQKVKFTSSVGLGVFTQYSELTAKSNQVNLAKPVYKDILLHGPGQAQANSPNSDLYLEKLKIDDTISIFISDLQTGIIRKDAFLTKLDPNYFPDPQNAINTALRNIKSDYAGTYDALDKLLNIDKAPDKVKAIALLEQGKLAIDTTIRDYSIGEEKFKEIISKYSGELNFDGTNIAHQAHFHLEEIAYIPEFSQSRAPEYEDDILQSSNPEDLESANDFFTKGIQFFEDPTENNQPLLLTPDNLKRGQEHLVYLRDIKDRVNVKRGLAIYGLGAEHLGLAKDALKAEIITAIGEIDSLDILEDEKEDKILSDFFNKAYDSFSLVKDDEENILSFQSADEWEKDISQIIGAIQIKEEELNKK